MITRDEFIRLSTPEMLVQIWDLLQSRPAAASASPGGATGAGDGRCPQYDWSIARKGGMVQYASETDLDGLVFWRNRSAEPASDPKYAESNTKAVKALDYWIAYRRAEPNAVWSGERNRQKITAAAPSAKPATYPRAAAGAVATPAVATPSFDENDDIPFIENVTNEPTERWHRPRRTVG